LPSRQRPGVRSRFRGALANPTRGDLVVHRPWLPVAPTGCASRWAPRSARRCSMGSCSPPFVRPERFSRTTGTIPTPCEPMVRSVTSPQPSSASWTSPFSGTSLPPCLGSEVRRARDNRYPTGPASGSVKTSGLTLTVDSVLGAGQQLWRRICQGIRVEDLLLLQRYLLCRDIAGILVSLFGIVSTVACI